MKPAERNWRYERAVTVIKSAPGRKRLVELRDSLAQKRRVLYAWEGLEYLVDHQQDLKEQCAKNSPIPKNQIGWSKADQDAFQRWCAEKLKEVDKYLREVAPEVNRATKSDGSQSKEGNPHSSTDSDQSSAPETDRTGDEKDNNNNNNNVFSKFVQNNIIRNPILQKVGSALFSPATHGPKGAFGNLKIPPVLGRPL